MSVPRLLRDWRLIRKNENPMKDETRLWYHPLNVVTLAADLLDVLFKCPENEDDSEPDMIEPADRVRVPPCSSKYWRGVASSNQVAIDAEDAMLVGVSPCKQPILTDAA